MKKMPQANLPAIIFVAFLLLYSALIVLRPVPFWYDESIYAIMVKEFYSNPSAVMPTINGEHVEWKPPLFVWVYSVFYMILRHLPLQPEVLHRLPSAFFGAANATLVFMLAKRLYGNRVALASVLLFGLMPIIIFSATTAMMEAFSLFLMLCSIWYCLERRYAWASLALGCLALTKWLYVPFPIIFLVAWFARDSDLRKVVLTFLSVPAALAFYLMLAYFFGNFGNAVATMTFDLSRPLPGSGISYALPNYIVMFAFTFPLAVLAILLSFASKPSPWGERAVIALCAVGFLLPLSHLFLFWYLTPVLFAFAIFIALRLEALGGGPLFLVVLGGLVLMNLFMLAMPLLQPEPYLKEVLPILNGGGAAFLEPHVHFPVWESVNRMYKGTANSFLLLEQLNPGILYYALENNDHPAFSTVLTEYGEQPQCGSWLVVHARTAPGLPPPLNWTVPSCLRLAWDNERYIVYAPVGNGTATARP